LARMCEFTINKHLIRVTKFLYSSAKHFDSAILISVTSKDLIVHGLDLEPSRHPPCKLLLILVAS
jgi:hypothetical protein